MKMTILPNATIDELFYKAVYAMEHRTPQEGDFCMKQLFEEEEWKALPRDLRGRLGLKIKSYVNKEGASRFRRAGKTKRRQAVYTIVT